MQRRPIARAAIVASAVLGATLTANPAQAAPPDPVPVDCPTPLPTAEAVEGLRGVGYTVSQGTQRDRFTAKVLGRITNGIAPGVDMIMAELDSPALTTAGGAWSGMSGSPVYAPNGKLIGAVAYGLAETSSPIAGLTPAESMERLLTSDPDDGVTGTRATSSRIRPDAQTVRKLVGTGDLTGQQAANGFRALPLPLIASGLTGPDQAARIKAIERRTGQRVIAAPSSTGALRAAATPDEILGGSNFAAAVSYGSFTLGAVGTATFTCKGRVVAFGHPFTKQGIVALSAHAASAILIQPNPTGPFKVANIGDVIGSVDRDRSAGVRATFGSGPRGIQVTSSLTRTETGRTQTAKTTVVHPEDLTAVADQHAGGQLDSVAASFGAKSSAQLTLTVTGQRADATGFSVKLSESFVAGKPSDPPLVMQVMTWVDSMVGPLDNDQDFEDVTIDEIHLSGTVSSRGGQWITPEVRYAQRGVYGTYPKGLTAKAGQVLHLRTSLAQLRTPSVRTTVNAAVKVPRSARGHELDVIVAADSDRNREPYDRATFMSGLTSFPQILAKLRTAPRSDEIIVKLVDAQTGKVRASKRIRLSQPVIAFQTSNRLQVR